MVIVTTDSCVGGLDCLGDATKPGTGLGSSFGGSGVSYHSRKGLERYVFVATVGLIVLFTGLAVMSIML